MIVSVLYKVDGGGGAEYSFIALLDFVSMGAFEDAAGRHGKEILGDIPNFTDVTPVILIGEVHES